MTATYHIKTFGCQMNAYDSERIGELLEAQGHTAAGIDTAEIVVLNTCHIREKAAEKVYSDIGRLKASRRPSGVKPTVVVAGCVAQAEGAEIVRRAPSVDVVVGPNAYHRLPAMLRAGGGLDTDMPLASKFDALPARRSIVGASAFLTVQEGCDKFCTFCVVPYTRGAEVSRPVAKIIDDVKRLADNGVIRTAIAIAHQRAELAIARDLRDQHVGVRPHRANAEPREDGERDQRPSRGGGDRERRASRDGEADDHG